MPRAKTFDSPVGTRLLFAFHFGQTCTLQHQPHLIHRKLIFNQIAVQWHRWVTFHKQQRSLNCQSPSSDQAHKEKIEKSATQCTLKKASSPSATHQNIYLRSSLASTVLRKRRVFLRAQASGTAFSESMLNAEQQTGPDIIMLFKLQLS